MVWEKDPTKGNNFHIFYLWEDGSQLGHRWCPNAEAAKHNIEELLSDYPGCKPVVIEGKQHLFEAKPIHHFKVEFKEGRE